MSKITDGNGLRQAFIEYFVSHQHERVDSSSLVPSNDPSLLFTNAGMVQFKEVFLGLEQRANPRAVSSQRCVRAGGKHNDLDNVGYTARHHTFFEMLGNFSFGDYFKREAIAFAWEFLTVKLGLPAEKLWVTVYKDDAESEAIWLDEMKVSSERFSRCGEADNFWSMGDTGPCGPCTEIFYDHGPSVEGGPPGTPEQEGDRYVEIWNLVFMQYNRASDGTMSPLPKPSVDTGMGLERLAAVMQGVHSNYETDLFSGMIRFAAQLAGLKDESHPSLRVIADHIRSTSFLIVDGVSPSNEGRGYVLRRIIRRAIRHGNTLGIKEVFFYKMLEPLIAQMGEAYPELANARTVIESVLREEETQFLHTLDTGLKILDKAIAEVHTREIPGEVIFKLYDTYGFPVDLTADIAREHDLHLDYAGFEQCMEKQRESSKQASRFVSADAGKIQTQALTAFSGYDSEAGTASILEIHRPSSSEGVKQLVEGESAVIVLDTSPFYPEGGGQMGDAGTLVCGDASFEVSDTQKQGNAILHHGVMKRGSLQVGAQVEATVDASRRQAIRLNHSATHLLHAALRQIVGSHVVQKGSLVAPDKLRFDFSHTKALTRDEWVAIEDLVNDKIRENLQSDVVEMSLDEAKECGAMALFGERYAADVRVMSMGDFSKEVCGGIHVHSSGEIGYFKITLEEGIASGVRRLEAVTGYMAVTLARRDRDALEALANSLKVGRQDLANKVTQLLEQNRELKKAHDTLQAKLSSASGASLAQQAKQVGQLKVLAANIPGANVQVLRQTLDDLKSKLGAAAIVLASVNDGKVALVAGVTKAESKLVHAGELVNHVAKQVGGKGGGRPDMAQAGGTDPARLNEALDSVQAFVTERAAE